MFLAGLSANPFLFYVVTSVIAARDLELPFVDVEDDCETLAKPSAEATPSARKNKRKEATQGQDSAVQPDPPGRILVS